MPVCYYYALENYSAFTYIMGNNSNDDLSKFRKGPGGRARVILGRRVQFTHGVFTWDLLQRCFTRNLRVFPHKLHFRTARPWQ